MAHKNVNIVRVALWTVSTAIAVYACFVLQCRLDVNLKVEAEAVDLQVKEAYQTYYWVSYQLRQLPVLGRFIHDPYSERPLSEGGVEEPPWWWLMTPVTKRVWSHLAVLKKGYEELDSVWEKPDSLGNLFMQTQLSRSRGLEEFSYNELGHVMGTALYVVNLFLNQQTGRRIPMELGRSWMMWLHIGQLVALLSTVVGAVALLLVGLKLLMSKLRREDKSHYTYTIKKVLPEERDFLYHYYGKRLINNLTNKYEIEFYFTSQKIVPYVCVRGPSADDVS